MSNCVLAYLCVIRFPSGYFVWFYSVLGAPGRTFGLEPRGDFSDVVQRCQCDYAAWQKGPKLGWEQFEQGFRNAADVEAMIAHADPHLAIVGSLGPKTNVAQIHRNQLKQNAKAVKSGIGGTVPAN
ncbi:MAG: hypothetical protein RMH97_00390 [Verrucomicrobiales bacterium]|nr:hypothetical protein [Verrucomicrobiales bacterium]